MPQEFKGRKVKLRLPRRSDAATFCRWLRDEEVTKFLAIYDEKPPTLAEEKKWIEKTNRSKTVKRFVIETSEGRPIGVCSLEKIDSIHRRALLGIFIGEPEYWGQGYGTEATHMLVRYGFSALKLHRIYLTVYAFNVRAVKAYQKVGFRIEGRLRDHIWRDGHFHDEIQMGMLKHELKKINHI